MSTRADIKICSMVYVVTWTVSFGFVQSFNNGVHDFLVWIELESFYNIRFEFFHLFVFVFEVGISSRRSIINPKLCRNVNSGRPKIIGINQFHNSIIGYARIALRQNPTINISNVVITNVRHPESFIFQVVY